MKRALLDVNVLLALAWPNHQHHAPAHRWFASTGRRGWATCALTELAFVRLSSNPAFTRGAVTPSTALDLLARMRRQGSHRAWTDLPPVAGLAGMRLLGHQQMSEAFLVLTARRNGGLLATFDGRLAGWAGAAADVSVIPS